MVGLRQRKKEETRRRILEVGAAHIAGRDFAETTMEWIAAEADVSVGTVYNYFGSKTVLLLAILSEDADQLATRITAVLDDPGCDAVAAVQRMLDIYLDVIFELGRDLMREMFRASFDRSSGEFGPEFIRLDEPVLEGLARLMAHFGEERLVATDVDGRDAASLLFAAVALNVILYLTLEDLPEEGIRAQVHRQVGVAFRGLGAVESADGHRPAER